MLRPWILCSALLVIAHAALLQAAALVQPRDQGGWQATGRTYTAIIDPSGRLISLKMGDVELLGDDPKHGRGAPFPGREPPSSINLHQNMLAMRNPNVRLSYAFDETGIDIETEGDTWRCALGATFTAFITSDGGAVRHEGTNVGNIRRFIIGSHAFEMSEPFHLVGGRILPSALPSNRRQAEAPAAFRIELGLSADATALIAVRSLAARESDHRLAPWIPRGRPAVYRIELENLGQTDRDISISYRLATHYVGGAQTDAVALPPLSIPAGETAGTSFEVDAPQPGCHWLNFELITDGQVLKREQRFFVYAAEEYLPVITRPSDFQAFWEAQLRAMRDEPLDAQLVEIPERSTEAATYYTLSLTHRGQRHETGLSVPRRPGPHVAVFGGRLVEMATDEARIILRNPRWPEQATFRRWIGHDDNNLLDCYLLAIRFTDYLRARDDVAGIHLTGASRQGPIALANAALDPSRILSVSAHVPTSLGISWTTYPYRGWGDVPNPPTMAAYVDPVNFAPDLTVPYIMDLGAYDGLSPVPGGLAFHHLATRSPLRLFSIELGGHGYFTSPFKKQAQEKLDTFLQMHTPIDRDDRVLREH